MALAMAKKRTRRLGRRFGKYMRTGSDTQREVYRRMREAANYPAVRDRRRAAAGTRPDPGLAIARHEGFRLLGPGSLAAVDDVVKAASAIAADFTPPPLDDSSKAKQQLLEGLLDEHAQQLDSPFVQLGLDEGLVGAVAAYLGTIPVLARMDVWYSRWTPTYENSQLFHCDWADTQQVKVFVYCTDVAAEHGPLCIIPADPSERLRKALHYAYSEARYRVSDDEVARVLGPGVSRPLTGERGTVAMVDTSRCFHQGSRITSPELNRVVAVIQYLTPTAFCFPGRMRTGPYERLCSPELSPLQQRVLRVS